MAPQVNRIDQESITALGTELVSLAQGIRATWLPAAERLGCDAPVGQLQAATASDSPGTLRSLARAVNHCLACAPKPGLTIRCSFRMARRSGLLRIRVPLLGSTRAPARESHFGPLQSHFVPTSLPSSGNGSDGPVGSGSEVEGELEPEVAAEVAGFPMSSPSPKSSTGWGRATARVGLSGN